MKTNWEEIVDYLMSCKEVHKFGYIKEGWIYVSDKDGTRHKITEKSKLEDVKKIVDKIMKS